MAHLGSHPLYEDTLMANEITFKFVPDQELSLTAYEGPDIEEAVDLSKHVSGYRKEKTSVPFAHLVQPIKILSVTMVTNPDIVYERNIYRVSALAITV